MKIEEVIKAFHMPAHTKTIVHLVYTSNFLTEQLTEVIKPFDISMQQFNVLRILRGQNGKPANLFTIQERMINKMSNTTRLIDKLILKDYVERKICPKNRRKVEILITQKGLKTLEKLDDLVISTQKKIMEPLTDNEVTIFNQILDKLRT